MILEPALRQRKEKKKKKKRCTLKKLMPIVSKTFVIAPDTETKRTGRRKERERKITNGSLLKWWASN